MRNTFRLVICGDLFPTEKNYNEFSKGEIENLFDKLILDKISRADFFVFNLEGCLTNYEYPIKKCDPKIKAPIETVKGIKKLNPDIIALANNHIMDFGEIGFFDTCRVLKDNGLDYFGIGKNSNSLKNSKIISTGTLTIALYNVAETMFNVPHEDKPGVNVYDEYRVCKEIGELKKICDFVVVLYHGGVEFFWYTSELLRKRFHRMADSGADIVIAQHTHNISVKENYKESYLNYGQGDFLFATSVSEYKETGLLLEIVFQENEFYVMEHLMRHEGKRVYLEESQDLSEYNLRSERLQSGDLFIKEYEEYSRTQMVKFLRAFRGNTFIDKLMYRLLPREKFLEYIISKYDERHILRMISSIQFEEFNDIVGKGLEVMLKECKR